MEKKNPNSFRMRHVYAGPEQMKNVQEHPDERNQTQKEPQENLTQQKSAEAAMAYAGPRPNPKEAAIAGVSRAYPFNFAENPNPIQEFAAVYAGPPIQNPPSFVLVDPASDMTNGINPPMNGIPGEPVPYCHICGAKFPDGAKFCTECGTPRILVKKCPSCGARLSMNPTFCAFCGARMVAKK